MISPNYVTETFHPAFPSPMSAAGTYQYLHCSIHHKGSHLSFVISQAWHQVQQLPMASLPKCQHQSSSRFPYRRTN